MITWNKFCPCKYFTRANLGIQYSTRIDLREEASFYRSEGKGMGGAVNSNILPLSPKYCILFRHPRDFTNKVPAPPWFYQENSGTFLNIPYISWSEFSLVRNSKARSSVFHCISICPVKNSLRSLELIETVAESSHHGVPIVTEWRICLYEITRFSRRNAEYFYIFQNFVKFANKSWNLIRAQ
jgi:hypothetical protein